MRSASSEGTKQARSLRPRETSKLSVAPLAITDLTCAAIIGIEPRVFREWLVAASVPFTRIGRRVIARADHVLAALGEASPSTAPSVAHDEPETADDVLASIGLKRSA